MLKCMGISLICLCVGLGLGLPVCGILSHASCLVFAFTSLFSLAMMPCSILLSFFFIAWGRCCLNVANEVSSCMFSSFSDSVGMVPRMALGGMLPL